MDAERRSTGRARVAGVQATYESASGERIEADVLDVGSGGLFVHTSRPAPVGKRLSLEIRLPEGTTWSAICRVVWAREVESAGGLPGMGMKLIDIEDAALEAIERLVDAPQKRVPGANPGKARAREPTLVGVGTSEEPALAAAPARPVEPTARVMPSQERTVLGVGTVSAATSVARVARERSVPPPEGWDPPQAPAASLAVASGPTAPRAPSPRRRRWPALLLLVVVAGVGVHAMRDRIPWERLRSLVAADPPSSPVPVPAAQVGGAPEASAASSGSHSTQPTPIPTQSAGAAIANAASAASPDGLPLAHKPPTHRPTSVPRGGSRGATNDNPYGVATHPRAGSRSAGSLRARV